MGYEIVNDSGYEVRDGVQCRDQLFEVGLCVNSISLQELEGRRSADVL